MLTIYGIPNCDTCRNARKWLEQRTIPYHFHDLRADGLNIETLTRWAEKTSWQALLNTRSRTWRQVPQSQREQIDSGSALALMLDQPTLIKRPLLEGPDIISIGFTPAQYDELFP